MTSSHDRNIPKTTSAHAWGIKTRPWTYSFGEWTVKTTVVKTETITKSHKNFFRVYGRLGIPMVIIFFLSASWTLILAVIQYMPNEFANWVMNTESFDDGEFWMLPDPDISIKVASMVVLCSLSVGYLSLVVIMFFPDRMVKSKIAYTTATSASETSEEVTRNKLRESSSKISATSATTRAPMIRTGLDRLRFEITSPYGLLRQYYNPLLDLPKLLFQTATLLTYLHDGFPLAIINIYSSLLFINWMISSYRYKRWRPDPHLVLVRLFYSFDLFFAVFAPLEVLVYARYRFIFDRDEYQTRVEALVPGVFDRVAKLYADPVQVSRFRIGFHYLQFSSVSSLLIKSVLNVLSLYKWMRTIVLLVRNDRSGTCTRKTQSNDCSFVMKARRRRDVQNHFISTVFFCVGVAILVHATLAITSTKSVCDTYRQCAVPRYQWNVGATHCSCIVFVDRSASVRTFGEWENPPDTTANLAALATTGHLRIIQIINYALPELPNELRGCHELEQLILIYTKTVRFPSWAKELRHLEYMHIEGDFTSRQLVNMPDDLFEGMHSLVFLHLGSLIQIPRVPDLQNLTRLRFLLLSLLHAVTELPSLEGLTNLRSVSIVDAAQVQELPSISKLHLQFFALAGRNPVCCNGFMTGSCDLSDHQCQAHDNERPVECTTKRYSAPDLALATSIPGIVCEQHLTIDLKEMVPTVALTDVACGGVMYKQCELNGVAGMCINARMAVVSCVVSPEYEKMRRLQIARGVAKPCDPKVEAWLGCTK